MQTVLKHERTVNKRLKEITKLFCDLIAQFTFYQMSSTWLYSAIATHKNKSK